MDQSTLGQLKEKLLTQKAELERDLQKESAPTPDEPDNRTAKFPEYGQHEDENASEVADFTANLGIEKSREQMLDEVKRALRQIEDGSYGKCKNCNQEISAERLMANPTASLCLNCATK